MLPACAAMWSASCDEQLGVSELKGGVVGGSIDRCAGGVAS